MTKLKWVLNGDWDGAHDRYMVEVGLLMRDSDGHNHTVPTGIKGESAYDAMSKLADALKSLVKE